MQVPLNETLREFITSGFVQYDYITIGLDDPVLEGALR